MRWDAVSKLSNFTHFQVHFLASCADRFSLSIFECFGLKNIIVGVSNLSKSTDSL